MGSNRKDFIKGAKRNTIGFSMPFTGFRSAVSGRSWFSMQKAPFSSREQVVGLCVEAKPIFFAYRLCLAVLFLIRHLFRLQFYRVVFVAIDKLFFSNRKAKRIRFIRDENLLEGCAMSSYLHIFNSSVFRLLSKFDTGQPRNRSLVKWRKPEPYFQHLYAPLNEGV